MAIPIPYDPCDVVLGTFLEVGVSTPNQFERSTDIQILVSRQAQTLDKPSWFLGSTSGDAGKLVE